MNGGRKSEREIEEASMKRRAPLVSRRRTPPRQRAAPRAAAASAARSIVMIHPKASAASAATLLKRQTFVRSLGLIHARDVVGPDGVVDRSRTAASSPLYDALFWREIKRLIFSFVPPPVRAA